MEEKNPDTAATPLSSPLVALEETHRIPQTIAYFAAFVALGLSSTSTGATLSELAKNTQTDYRSISILFTARSLGYLLASFGIGKLYNKTRGNRIMSVALLSMALMAVLIPVIPTLWLLAAAILIAGTAEGTLDVGGNTLLVWVHGKRVAPFMNALHFFFGVGAFLSPFILAQIMLVKPLTTAYGVLAFLMLPVAFWVLRLPSPVPQVNNAPAAHSRVNKKLVALIAAFFFLYLGAEVGFGGWITTYVISTKLSNETVARYLTSAFWGSLTIGRLLAIPLAARFKPRNLLIGNLLGCLLSLAIILLWPRTLAAVWVGAVGLGLSMASIFPTMFSFAERRLTITGQVTGWFIMGASAGGMFLPWLIGQLFEKLGPQIMLQTILIDLVATLVVFVLLVFTSHRRNEEANQATA
ncbi:MAG: MFS transporter [Acidobacteria bacterium]|nr:MFS transporter [Acidobacteriota bacterium]